MMSEGSGLHRRQLCFLVVVLPGAFETESKAAPQEIRIPDGMVRHAKCELLLPADDFRIRAFLCIKIEVSFHTAGKHIQFRLSHCPECSQQAATPLGSGLNEDTAPARTGRVNRCFETVTCQ